MATIERELDSWWDQPPQCLENAPPEQVFRDLLMDAIGLDPNNVKALSGAHTQTYCSIDEKFKAELSEIHPNLDFGVMHSQCYWTKQADSSFRQAREELRDTRFRINGVSFHLRDIIEQLAKERLKQLSEFANEASSTPFSEEIEFAESPYTSMNGFERSCSLANFLSVYTGVTGEKITINQGRDALHSALYLTNYDGSTDRDVPDNTLLNLFNSAEFTRVFNVEVRPIMFAGLAISDLLRVIRTIKNSSPDTEVRASLCVRSESANKRSGIWHQILPIHIDPNETIAHDPASYGSPNKKFKTNDILERWYEAQGRGYLVLSNTSPEDC